MSDEPEFYDDFDENYIEEVPEGEAATLAAPTWVSMEMLRLLRDKMGLARTLEDELWRAWPSRIGDTVRVRMPNRFRP